MQSAVDQLTTEKQSLERQLELHVHQTTAVDMSSISEPSAAVDDSQQTADPANVACADSTPAGRTEPSDNTTLNVEVSGAEPAPAAAVAYAESDAKPMDNTASDAEISAAVDDSQPVADPAVYDDPAPAAPVACAEPGAKPSDNTTADVVVPAVADEVRHLSKFRHDRSALLIV